jgi:hypothetical protein
MNNCLCIICFKPDDVWINFLDKFINYDIYLIIDDNSIDYTKKYKNTKINIIQISYDDCVNNGFHNMTLTVKLKNDNKKRVCGWDKALYYFSIINTKYDNVWFIEDDVFFYNEDTILNIDKKYNSDLLTNMYSENINGNKKNWHWKRVNITFSPPYYNCMCCAIRVSKNLISKIKDYAKINNTLFFLEVLFPTLCKHNNLLYDNPDELKNIVYRKDFNIKDITKFNLYHPVKNMNNHNLFRNIN